MTDDVRPSEPDFTVYLAGPLGFLAAGRHYHDDVLVPAVARHFAVLDPWARGDEIIGAFTAEGDGTVAPDRLAALNRALGAGNRELLGHCDAVLAVLDGPDVDSGTAAEIGYAAALGTPVVGLRTDIRLSGENPAAVVNLQVAHFVEHSGGRIVRDLGEAIDALGALARRDGTGVPQPPVANATIRP